MHISQSNYYVIDNDYMRNVSEIKHIIKNGIKIVLPYGFIFETLKGDPAIAIRKRFPVLSINPNLIYLAPPVRVMVEMERDGILFEKDLFFRLNDARTRAFREFLWCFRTDRNIIDYTNISDLREFALKFMDIYMKKDLFSRLSKLIEKDMISNGSLKLIRQQPKDNVSK